MSRPFIIRVRSAATGAFVNDVTLEVRTEQLFRRFNTTLLRDDEDGFLSGMLPGPFAGPFPTFVRVSARGFADGPWEQVPMEGPISLDLELIPLAQADFIETAFSARVRLVTRAMGQDIDRDRRNIPGRVAFDLVAGTLSLVEFAPVVIPVQVPVLGSIEVTVLVTETSLGTFDPATGHGSLNLSAFAEANTALVGASTVAATLDTTTAFADIGMTSFPLDGREMRIAGSGTGVGGALNNQNVRLAVTFDFDDRVPVG